MIHPKRLLDGEGTEIERLLLASGRAARPSPRAKWRTAILFLLMSVGTVSKAHAVALLGAKIRALTVAQWLALGVGTGAAGWVAVHAKPDVPPDPIVAVADPPLRRIPAAHTRGEHRVVPQPPPAPVAVNGIEASPSSPALSEHAPVQTASPLVSRPKRGTTAAAVVAPPAGDRSIASEVDELDRVRDVLSTGEPKRALDRLNRYDRLFPQGTLREEALRLRIEAVATTGDRATARTLAQRFFALYPDSAHSERLKALVRDP